MAWRRLRSEAEGLFWQLTAPARAQLRALRSRLALARWRRRRRTDEVPFRVAVERPSAGSPPPRAPAIAVLFAPGADGAAWERALARQSESAWSRDASASEPSWTLTLADAPRLDPPRAALETLLLAGESADLDWVGTADHELLLLRQPRPGSAPAARLGRLLRFPPAAPAPALAEPWTVADGHWLLGEPPADGVLELPARSLAGRLPLHPSRDRATALLLLPYLAVGGAERLLLDYAAAVAGRRRLLVVTTEPHRPELGNRLAEADELLPVYPLGDLLPRELHLDALATLLERHRADALACWNGCTLFYDAVDSLRRRFPRLRISHQLFDHRVGWIRRLTPQHRRVIDCHLAANRPIADELEHGQGVPRERIALVRHGIAPPPPELPARRRELRAELGIAGDVPLVASFLRLHAQKRPFDILELARRFRSDEARFLLVGGGPLEAAIDAELARRPLPQLLRRPLEPHPERWLDAVDLCLLTSQHEGLPLFLLEGMAHGRPAVATAVGEVPELLAPGGGRSAGPGDLDGLERGLRALLDPALRRQAGEIARRTIADRHSLERFVDETDAALFGEATR